MTESDPSKPKQKEEKKETSAELEVRKQAIISELDQKKKEAKDKGDIFNNLRMHLPGKNGISPQQKMLEGFGGMDDEPLATGREQGVSELARRTNEKEYSKMIKSVLEKLSAEGKINVEEMKDLVDESAGYLEKGDRGRAEDRLTDEFLEPIYIELRLLGFSHYDLWR